MMITNMFTELQSDEDAVLGRLHRRLERAADSDGL
ncbi:MAG: hypothetical protein JWR37_2578, partial [Mycobacterium sp.]|nr:hypothetical protein [Mycobacterium sp.]